MKTALIVGGSSGIGQVIIASLKNSFNIAAHCCNNCDGINKLKKTDGNRIVEPFCYDLLQPGNSEKLVEDVIQKFGGIDVLINTIGPFYYQDILEVTPDGWSRNINTNLNVVFNVVYFANKHIIESKGHIINFAFSGVENLKTWEMSTGYCAAKAGIVVLTKSLASKLAPYGVRVNAICPGLIEGPETSKQEREEMTKQIPVGRPGKPSEIAEVVKWVITESPDYLTGALIPVSGAWEY